MDEDDGDFTFAVAAPLAGSDGIFPGDRRIGAGRMYPVFGRPRSPPRQQAPEQEPETTTATARVPLGRVLLVDRGRAGAAQPPYDEEPEKTRYFSWCPGLSAAAKAATRCRKSGSTYGVAPAVESAAPRTEPQRRQGEVRVLGRRGTLRLRAQGGRRRPCDCVELLREGGRRRQQPWPAAEVVPPVQAGPRGVFRQPHRVPSELSLVLTY
jgi:hypothetical protein